MSLSRRCQSWASCSWRGQNPDDLQDADEHVHQGGDEGSHKLTALQSFNERATITKLSAFGTWESISISPFFLKRQWLRIHSVHKTSDQWLLAVAIVSRPPPSVDNVSRELLCRRKMSLPDTVLFWFRSQIAQLSFHIDNKEMVLFPKSCDLRSKPSSRERERDRERGRDPNACGDRSTLDLGLEGPVSDWPGPFLGTSGVGGSDRHRVT